MLKHAETHHPPPNPPNPTQPLPNPPFSFLHPCQSMSDVVGADTIVDKILPVTLSLMNDPIPNIRFNVAKALERMIPSLKVANRQTIDAHIKPALEKLASDTDLDVRFFAQRALQRMLEMRPGEGGGERHAEGQGWRAWWRSTHTLGVLRAHMFGRNSNLKEESVHFNCKQKKTKNGKKKRRRDTMLGLKNRTGGGELPSPSFPSQSCAPPQALL